MITEYHIILAKKLEVEIVEKYEKGKSTLGTLLVNFLSSEVFTPKLLEFVNACTTMHRELDTEIDTTDETWKRVRNAWKEFKPELDEALQRNP